MSVAAPIEDFLEAITAQLDRTQDALRLKAVNRPLTFALKDFEIDLSVFIEMDRDGRVRLRPSVANESGASSIHIGFTTITRPMIEENTIAMELTQSESLEEAGFDSAESQRLERLGVRNTVQLRRLQEESDDESLASISGVDAGRLREVLQVRSSINYVDIGPGRRTESARGGSERPKIALPRGQEKLRFRGDGLVNRGRGSQVRLDGAALPIRSMSATHLDVVLPANTLDGVIEVELPDGHAESFELVTEGHLGSAPLPDHDVDEQSMERWSSPAGDTP